MSASALEAALHAHAEGAERRFARTFVTSMRAIRPRITESIVAEAMRRGPGGWRLLEPIIDAAVIAKEAVPQESATRAYAEVMNGAMRVSLPFNLAELGLTGSAFDLGMRIINPEVERAASAQAARLIREVNASTKQALRDIFVRGAREGISPYKLSKDVQRAVGLHSKQAMAVMNYRRGLEELAEGKRRSRAALQRQWSLSPRVPKALPPDRIDALVDQYAERQLRYRANMIARTETLRATNMGQEQVWESMQRQGVLRADAQKRWVVTHDNRLCKRCAPMDGKVALIRGYFRSDSLGIGKDVTPLPERKQVTTRVPPIHPHCRCTLRLVRRVRVYAPSAA